MILIMYVVIVIVLEQSDQVLGVMNVLRDQQEFQIMDNAAELHHALNVPEFNTFSHLWIHLQSVKAPAQVDMWEMTYLGNVNNVTLTETSVLVKMKQIERYAKTLLQYRFHRRLEHVDVH